MLSLLVISVYVINLGYGFEMTCRSIGSFRFQSLTLTGAETLTHVPETGANRFAGTWYTQCRFRCRRIT